MIDNTGIHSQSRCTPFMFFIFLFLAGCVNEKACEECIADQIAVKKLIQKDYPAEKIIIPTRDMARYSCSIDMIAPITPCKPRYWPLALGVIILGGVIIWRKRT